MKNIAIIGGGIVGLAVGYKLSLTNKFKIAIFEKENQQGQHQSGNNSGVLHCGLSYTPKSLKARLAFDGIRQMKKFCANNDIAHDVCGQIVVASNDEELKTLENVAKKGKANSLEGLKYLTHEEIKQREPFVRAKKALLVPEEGIVDYKAVMQRLVDKIKENSNEIYFSSNIKKVKELNNEIIVYSNNNEYKFDLVVNCTGLYSDITYKNFTDKERPLRIVPFRGEYMSIKKEYHELINHLIYPVPNPQYPFLGVHFTRMIDGGREVGPNAVFALKREGYTNKTFSLNDAIDSLSYRGLHKFVFKNFRFAMNEFASSLSKKSFLNKAKKLVPDIELHMIEKGIAGVRAQAMDTNGALIMDFRIEREGNQIHVLNAPSPGATASLAIADYVIKNYIA